MPPRGHSGGSFGGGGHSSFSGGRSSFGSSRPSSHSGSSFSRPSSGPSFSRPSASPSRPSPRPSSGFSGPRPSYSRPAARPTPVHRPRRNQPLYRPSLITPILRTCLNHEYLYFSEPWDYEGKHYDAGYYDENGKYYKEVAMKQEDGTTTVELECEYCGNRVKVEWKEGEMPVCSHCGAPMKLPDMETDTLNSETAYTEDAASSASYEKPTLLGRMKKHPVLTFVILVFICMLIKSAITIVRYESEPVSYSGGSGYEQAAVQSNTQLFGRTVYLEETGIGTYRRVSASSGADKTVTWSSDAESYYDKATDTYLWYNNETADGVWQYWVEGISSRYGDYGWMEYDASRGIWGIETSANNWVEYTGDTSALWHIDE